MCCSLLNVIVYLLSLASSVRLAWDSQGRGFEPHVGWSNILEVIFTEEHQSLLINIPLMISFLQLHNLESVKNHNFLCACEKVFKSPDNEFGSGWKDRIQNDDYINWVALKGLSSNRPKLNQINLINLSGKHQTCYNSFFNPR